MADNQVGVIQGILPDGTYIVSLSGGSQLIPRIPSISFAKLSIGQKVLLAPVGNRDWNLQIVAPVVGGDQVAVAKTTTVRVLNTGIRVAGASVRLTRTDSSTGQVTAYRGSTNPTGEVIVNLLPGQYALTASKGSLSAAASVTLPQDVLEVSLG